MKNLLIDLYKINNMYSGLGQFSMQFAKQLEAQVLDKFRLNYLIPSKIDDKLFVNKTNLVKASFLKRYFSFINKKYFIWHSLQQFPAFFPRKSSIWVLTIHDLNFLIEKSEKKKAKYLKRLQKNVSRADYITTISNYSKLQIEKNIDTHEKEIHVIHNGVTDASEITPVKPDFINTDKFFFSIGIFNAKKNFKVLLPLMKYLKDFKLVIAGNSNTSYGNEIKEEIEKLGLQNNVILPGKVKEQHKQWLYQNCSAFLFPSIAEGFGLPVIEAMYAGKPVFISKFTSLPEVGGDMAFYFNDFNTENMVALIEEKLVEVNKDKQKFSEELKKHADKFSWNNCIEKYLNLYKEIESKHTKISL